MGWHYAALEDRFRRLSGVNGALAILDWDTAVVMPKKAADDRGEQLAVLGRIAHEILTHAETGEQLAGAESEEDLDPWQHANLREMRRRYRHAHALEPALVEALARATTTCEMTLARRAGKGRFRHARAAADRSRAAYPRAMPRSPAPRSACRPTTPCSTRNQPDLRDDQIVELFDRLAAELPPLLDAVMARQAAAPAVVLPAGPFPAARQKELGRALMARLGFDFDAGRLDESTHPFCGGTPADIRITTRYREDELVSALMGVLHETGHALYEAGLPLRWRGQPVGDQRGIAVHESQSLLMEMQACRSPAFVGFLAGQLQLTFGDDPAFAPDEPRAPLHPRRARIHPRRRRRGDLPAACHPAPPARAGADRGRARGRRSAGGLERRHAGTPGHHAARRPSGLPAGHPLARRQLRLFPLLHSGRHARRAALPRRARPRCPACSTPSGRAISRRCLPGCANGSMAKAACRGSPIWSRPLPAVRSRSSRSLRTCAARYLGEAA